MDRMNFSLQAYLHGTPPLTWLTSNILTYVTKDCLETVPINIQFWMKNNENSVLLRWYAYPHGDIYAYDSYQTKKLIILHAHSPAFCVVLERLPSGKATVSCKKHHSNSKLFDKFILLPVGIRFLYFSLSHRNSYSLDFLILGVLSWKYILLEPRIFKETTKLEQVLSTVVTKK